MNPDATWEMILKAIAESDWRGLEMAVLDLRNWLLGKGGMPKALKDTWEANTDRHRPPALALMFSALVYYASEMENLRNMEVPR